MKEIYTSPTKNYLQRNGFVMVSNLLLDFQEELDISDSELLFLIKILKKRNSPIIHDNELDKNSSSRTMLRRRTSLKEKGLINYSIVKKQNEKGTYQTDGVMYDLSPLEEKLQSISNKLEEKKENKLKQELKNDIVFTDLENESLQKYFKDFEDYYGVKYSMNKYEFEYFKNKLKDEDKVLIEHIFEYCEENELFDQITPRLSLFFKIPFRFNDLKKFCLKNKYIKSKAQIEQEKEEDRKWQEFLDEQEKLNKKTEEISYYFNLKEDEKFMFKKNIKELLYKNASNDEMIYTMFKIFANSNVFKSTIKKELLPKHLLEKVNEYEEKIRKPEEPEKEKEFTDEELEEFIKLI